MPSADAPILLAQLAALRTELIDLAYDLDVRGAHTAADVAITTSVRLAELCGEVAWSSARPLAVPVSESG